MRLPLACALTALILVAGGCPTNGSVARGTATFLQLAPFVVDLEVDRVSGVVGTSFSFDASAMGNESPIATWGWDFGDGETADTASADHTYGATGFFLVEVTATDEGGQSVTAGVVVAIYEEGAAITALGGEPLPARMGDVDGDGKITVADSHLILKHARGLAILGTAGQIAAADVDLDGDVDEEDARLLAGAIVAGQPVPRRITPDHGAPGTGVNVISPALLAAGAVVEVQVGASAPTPLFRPVLGYGSFLIPFDAVSNVMSNLQGQTVQIRILVDGAEEDSFDFELEDPEPIEGEPGEQLLALLDEMPRVVGALRPLLSDYFDFIGATEDERAVIEALLQMADEDMAAARPQIVEGLAKLDDETRLRIQQVANANGLTEALDDVRALLEQRQTQGLGDIVVTSICLTKTLERTRAQIDKVVGWICSFVEICAIVPSPAQPFCVALVPACAAYATTGTLIQMVSNLLPNIDSELLVTASPSVLGAGDQAELRVYARLRGIEGFCLEGGRNLEDALRFEFSKFLFRKLGGARVARTVLGRYPVDQRGGLKKEVVERLQKTLDFLVKRAFSALGINDLMKGIQTKVCSAVQDALGPSPFTVPVDDAMFLDPPAEVGSISGDAPEIFTCDPPLGTTRQVTLQAILVTECNSEPHRGEVGIKCSSGVSSVTIRMGDSGSILDDIFEVKVDGVTVLTSSVPVVSVSTTITLAAGPHTVEMIGRAAPDGIGTYFIEFTGATVTSGPPLRGGNLSAGTTFTFTIEVES